MAHQVRVDYTLVQHLKPPLVLIVILSGAIDTRSASMAQSKDP